MNKLIKGADGLWTEAPMEGLDIINPTVVTPDPVAMAMRHLLTVVITALIAK